MTETAAAIADQAREACPAWCAGIDKDHEYQQHASKSRALGLAPDTIYVTLRQGSASPRVYIGGMPVELTDLGSMTFLLRRLGHEDIAAAAEELAVLVGGGGVNAATNGGGGSPPTG